MWNIILVGIYNYEEYLLVRDTEEAEKERSMTLKRAHHQSGGLVGTLRDADKMEKLRKELHTDDEGEFMCVHFSIQGRALIGYRLIFKFSELYLIGLSDSILSYLDNQLSR